MARRNADYNIRLRGSINNNLLNFWTAEGYSINSNNLEKGQENQLLVEDDLFVNKGGGGRRRRIALLKRFGRDLLDNVSFVRLDKDDGKVLTYRKRKDYNINIPPRFNYNVRQLANVELYGKKIDTIPIIEVEYSTFVKGVYKPSGKPIDRVVVIEGAKKVKMGSRTPIGVNDAQFWSAVYRKLKSDLIDEFFEKGLAQDGWNTSDDFVTKLKRDASILQQGDFPQNYGDLKR